VSSDFSLWGRVCVFPEWVPLRPSVGRFVRPSVLWSAFGPPPSVGRFPFFIQSATFILCMSSTASAAVLSHIHNTDQLSHTGAPVPRRCAQTRPAAPSMLDLVRSRSQGGELRAARRARTAVPRSDAHFRPILQPLPHHKYARPPPLPHARSRLRLQSLQNSLGKSSFIVSFLS